MLLSSRAKSTEYQNTTHQLWFQLSFTTILQEEEQFKLVTSGSGFNYCNADGGDHINTRHTPVWKHNCNYSNTFTTNWFMLVEQILDNTVLGRTKIINIVEFK